MDIIPACLYPGSSSILERAYILAQPCRKEAGRTPEGSYRIDSVNRRSAHHLALHISYPKAGDVEAARKSGHSPGGAITIHGVRNGLGWVGRLHPLIDWTAGCIAVTNREIEGLWRAVPIGTRIEIQP